MARIFLFVTVLLNCGLQADNVQAQLRGYAAPPVGREPARVGLLGGLREAREERFRREEQAATAAAKAAAQRNAAANPAAKANSAAQQALGNPANRNTLGRETRQQSVEAVRTDSKSRSANYGNSNLSNPMLRPSPVVAAAAGALVPNPIRSEGPGVAIRLPQDAPGIVHYLVDDVESQAIRPGEQQVLDSKGSYVIRYSRGITQDGRSFGESRYTITEGRYRFELTETGWELYRESDFGLPVAPANRLKLAESQIASHPSRDLPNPALKPQSRRRLPTESLPTESLPTESLPTESLATEEPVANEPVAGEEVLPAPKPRSILE